MDYFSTVSAEIVLHIFSNLTPKEILRMQAMNKYLYKLGDDDRIWKQHLARILEDEESILADVEKLTLRKIFLKSVSLKLQTRQNWIFIFKNDGMDTAAVPQSQILFDAVTDDEDDHFQLFKARGIHAWTSFVILGVRVGRHVVFQRFIGDSAHRSVFLLRFVPHIPTQTNPNQYS